jgi:hypothetical protein
MSRLYLQRAVWGTSKACAFFESNGQQNIDSGDQCKEQVPRSHYRRCPEGEEPADGVQKSVRNLNNQTLIL